MTYDYSQVFSGFNMLAMTGWLLLMLAPKRWTWLLCITGILIPGILAAGYGGLMLTHMSDVQGGGYGSLAKVKTLMSYDAVLLAGWAHYLCFDLVIGTLIAREADKIGLVRLVQIPILFATFMFGPVGLLLFFLSWGGLIALNSRRFFNFQALKQTPQQSAQEASL